ncbi:MAG TPA: hypothetical protein VHM90_21650 [Phycisphaerae bacterium]|nr:hypothetical protein [Phycisphaerae bacterium]
MTENSELAAKPRTEEELAAVRRRALPVAIAGAILGILGILLPLQIHVAPYTPPSLMAMNFAFFAMMIGIGILFYAKGVAGTAFARVLCLVAIFSGIAGSLLYTRQAFDFRQSREGLELANIKALALAARDYAAQHNGQYPPDILTLLDDSSLHPAALQSPFGKRSDLLQHLPDLPRQFPKREDRVKAIDEASDYLYVGADLKSPPEDAQKDLIVALSANTVLREHAGVAYADGHATFFTRDDAGKVMQEWNAARRKIGMDEARPPALIEAALKDDAGKK